MKENKTLASVLVTAVGGIVGEGIVNPRNLQMRHCHLYITRYMEQIRNESLCRAA